MSGTKEVAAQHACLQLLSAKLEVSQSATARPRTTGRKAADQTAGSRVTRRLIEWCCCSLAFLFASQGYLSSISELQLVHGVASLSAAIRSEEQLTKHTKVWEEMIYPFKLLAECERKYYESEETENSDSGTRRGRGRQCAELTCASLCCRCCSCCFQ